MSTTRHTLELAAALDAVAAASRLAAGLQAGILARDERIAKDDHSPVTVADLAVQALVTDRLARSFPAVPMIAEEDSRQIRADEDIAQRVLAALAPHAPDLDADLLCDLLERGGHVGGPTGRHWVLDPIDGTKGFLRGEQYAIALALVEDGTVVLGVLGCPNLSGGDANDAAIGVLVAATRGGGAFERSLGPGPHRPIHVSQITQARHAVLCQSVESGHTAHGTAEKVAARLALEPAPLRLDSQAKYAMVARGDASLYLRLPTSPTYREKAWDHAAGAIVVEEAGGRVSDVLGHPLDLSGRTLRPSYGLVATGGAIHDEVLRAVRAELNLPADVR